MPGKPSNLRTAVVQTRLDVRTLATLYGFYKEHGIVVRNKSELLNIVCEDYLSILERNNVAERIEETSAAYNTLYRDGILRDVNSEPSRRALISQIQKETVLSEVAEMSRSITDGEVRDAVNRFTRDVEVGESE